MQQNTKTDRNSAGVVTLEQSHSSSQNHSSSGFASQDKEIKRVLGNVFNINVDVKNHTDKSSSSGQKKDESKSINAAFKDNKDHKDQKAPSTGNKEETKKLDANFDPKSNTSSKDQSKSSGKSSDQKSKATDLGIPEEALHIDPAKLKDVKSLDASKVNIERDLEKKLGENGDFLDPGGGINTVIGGFGNDIVRGDGGGFNTIAGGGGENLFILGSETTNRIFDFDSTKDRFGLTDGLQVSDIGFGQGTNPTKAGIDSPLDSNATVIFDKNGENHILGSLAFTKAVDLSEKNFVVVQDNDLNKVAQTV